jgi:hypothetical protein
MDAARTRATRFGVVVAATLATTALVLPATARGAVQRPPGTGKPTAGSGIGTTAALENPRCVHEQDSPRYGDYGAFDSSTVGGGPICVKPWAADDDNGGATYQGVTEDTIKVVALVPNEQQRANPAGSSPTNRATGAKGDYEDAIHDMLLSYLPWFETWGRDIEVKFLQSSGPDEAAQRADAVRAKAEKPFAAIHFIVEGLDVFEAEMANAKVLSWGYGTTTEKALAQEPYRWGQSDAQAGAINVAEVVGKQLVGKKAEYAGSDEIQGQTRTFGVVYMPNLIDVDGLKSAFAKYKGQIAVESPYDGNGATFGDPTVSQEAAPLAVSKMKAAGVTTAILFSDVSMTTALMEEAIKQEWYPEWFMTGAVYHDIGALMRGYPSEQSKQAFGISFLSPYLVPDDLLETARPVTWYWGEGKGTEAPSVGSQLLWFLNGVHAAGPKLTPKTFQQGTFSIPPTGGAATGNPIGSMTAYGKGAGLPYNEYMSQGLDYAPFWWDPDQFGPSSGNLGDGQGVGWYLDGAKRYKAGTWPKQQFAWFTKDDAIYQFDTRPVPIEYVGDCAACPAGTGVAPGAPNDDGFTAVHGIPGEAA